MQLGGQPKAFLCHRGHTMLEHGATYLSEVAGRLIMGLPADRVEEGRDVLAGTGAQCLAGGATKQETTSLLLEECTEDVVIVHDVSQFMPSPDFLFHVLAGLENADAAAPVVPLRVRGSLANRDQDGWMTDVLDRENAVMSHTPQAIRRKALVDALACAQREGWVENGLYALVHRNSGRVRMIDGNPDQQKLTYPDGLDMLKQA